MQPKTASWHTLDEAIGLSPGEGDGHIGFTSPPYQNMVGPFGGVTAATLLNSIMIDQQRQGQPVSLTVHFAAPIEEGEFSVNAKAMRTNRSTQHWSTELLQSGKVAAFASAVTARRRDTWEATDAIFPDVPPADEVSVVSALSEIPWTARYEMRFIDGGPGVAANAEHPSLTRLWIRDEPARPLDFQSLTAICDAFFPRIFVRRGQRVPIGTVALTTFFHADSNLLQAQGTKPVLGVARGLNFGKGFFDQSAEVWSTEGALLASSHQVVYFKD